MEDKTEQSKGEPEAWEVRPAAIQKVTFGGESAVRHLGASVSGNGNSQGQRPKVGAFLECRGTEKEKSMTAEGLWGPEWRIP